MALTYGMGYHVLVDCARLAPGENLLITGATGGVGSADETINYSIESLKGRTRELTEGVGADVIYDPVGGDTFLECLRCVNWEGRVLVVGFTSGRIPRAPMNLPVLKGCSIVGVFWGAYADRDPDGNRANFAKLLDWAARGIIEPRISARYPLKSAVEALSAIAERKVTGKVVLIPSRDGIGCWPIRGCAQ